jgi:Amt family ammonium transporter
MQGADTAWILTSTALVLFMTLPGLALFYAGLVRSQNVLSVLMNCFAIAATVSILWFAVGYSIAFGDGNAWWGGFGKSFLSGVGIDSLTGTIPENLFFMFQMTFAIITPALIVGAYPERIHFAFVIAFSLVWVLLVYAPVVHWVWGRGFLAEMGLLDFAGGVVVHVTAGVSALVLAMMLGPRRGFPKEVQPPHSPGLTMIGAAMLWVGWFGFNAGSAGAADGAAAMAMTVTHIAAAVAALTWMGIEIVRYGKPTLIGIVTGMVAGLATITPASGFVGPTGALILGLAAGAICYWVTFTMKNRLHVDDSLDVFAIHGVGGLIGSILVSVLAAPAFGGLGLAEGMSIVGHLTVQLTAIAGVGLWTLIVSLVVLKVLDGVIGLRVTPEEETEGLDLRSHGERAYDI